MCENVSDHSTPFHCASVPLRWVWVQRSQQHFWMLLMFGFTLHGRVLTCPFKTQSWCHNLLSLTCLPVQWYKQVLLSVCKNPWCLLTVNTYRSNFELRAPSLHRFASDLGFLLGSSKNCQQTENQGSSRVVWSRHEGVIGPKFHTVEFTEMAHQGWCFPVFFHNREHHRVTGFSPESGQIFFGVTACLPRVSVI